MFVCDQHIFCFGNV